MEMSFLENMIKYYNYFKKLAPIKPAAPVTKYFFIPDFLNLSQFTTFLRNNTTEYSNIVNTPHVIIPKSPAE